MAANLRLRAYDIDKYIAVMECAAGSHDPATVVHTMQSSCHSWLPRLGVLKLLLALPSRGSGLSNSEAPRIRGGQLD